MSSSHKKRSGSKSSTIAASPSTPPSSCSVPSHITDIRHAVRIEPSAASHTSSVLSSDAFSALNLNNSLSLESLQRDLSIDIIEISEDQIVFDIIGIDAAIANALRRILLAEVPTMAIEKVIIFQNTSIIQDEVLAHRLGLIPIKADPRQFKYLRESQGIPNEENTLVFTLDVHCSRRPGVPETATSQEKYNDSLITSQQLIWQPQGSQAERFHDNPISMAFDDIVVAKLRPGQSIEAELHAEKGIGATHAKWSPVATASYRLLPEIRIVQPVLGELAYELVNKCPMKVFDIEELSDTSTEKDSHHHHMNGSAKTAINSHVRAVVARPRNCSMCRECIRGPGWSDRVELRRVKQHFIFSVETSGAYQPAIVVKEAIKILKQKAAVIREELIKQQNEQQQQQQEEDTKKQKHRRPHQRIGSSHVAMEEEDTDDEDGA